MVSAILLADLFAQSLCPTHTGTLNNAAIRLSVCMSVAQGCHGDGISIPIPTPYPYPWESPWGSPYRRQTCCPIILCT